MTQFSISYFVAGAWSAPLTFDQAAVVSATRNLVNQGIDTCQVVYAGTNPPGANGFPFNSLVKILRDDFDGANGASNPKGWFVGRVVAPKKKVEGQSEQTTVTLNGPWWDLQAIVYQQLGLYYIPNGTEGNVLASTIVNGLYGPVVYFGAEAVLFNPVPVLVEASDVILTQNQQNGTPLDGSQTLSDALAYALAQGASLQVGSLPADQAIPSESATDPTCADMLKKVLKWLPGVVSWFDYTTDPPTINFADRTTRAAQTLAMGGNSPQVQSCALQARPDLILPGVTLYYLRKLTINTVVSETTSNTDSTGNTTSTTTLPEPGTTTPISGGIQGNSGYITTSQATTQAAGGSASSSTSTTTSSQEVNVLQFDQAGPDPQGIGALIATVQLQGGNVPVGVNTTPGPAFEATPTGLAAFIYNSRTLLSYEGQILLKGQDLVNVGNPIGSTVNISGGEPEWVGMLAEVQTSSENTATGATTLNVGAPKHLGASDLAALLQANRLRAYVSLSDSLTRTNGGAPIPPSGPIPPTPPQPPNKGGPPNGGGAGDGGGDGDATPTNRNGAGILDLYSGSSQGLAANTYLGARYPNGFGPNVQNPSLASFLQDPPGSGSPVDTGSAGSEGFFHNISAGMGATQAEGFDPTANPGGVGVVGESSCQESYTLGTLDLTNYTALNYTYAELRGSHSYTDATGNTKTDDYFIPVSQYLGMRQPGFRVYVPGAAANYDYVNPNGGSATRTKSESLTMTGLYVIARTG